MQTKKIGKRTGELLVNPAFSKKPGLVGKQGSLEDGTEELAGV